MGHPSRSMENGAEGDLSCGRLDQEVREQKNVSMWPKDWSCEILLKNMTAFCLCPKNKSF